MRNLSVLSLCFVALSAHAQFRVEANIRQRMELRDGYQMLPKEGSTPAFLVSQKTEFPVCYETDRLKIRITPQDVRLWGGDRVISTSGVASNTTMGLFEGYASLKVWEGLWITAGRQQLVYDNKRLLGDRNWNQNGISYDALVLKWSPANWSLHLGASWNTLNESLSGNMYPPDRIKSYNFVWLNRKLSEHWSLSFLHIATGVTETDTTPGLHFRQTSGFYTEYKDKNLQCWGNFYYQYGQNKSGKKLSAMLADADISYKSGVYRPGAGFGFLSGNSEAGTSQQTDHLFDVLYGNRHRYFGFMDYFRNFTQSTRQGGLLDLYAYVEWKITPAITLSQISHYFRLAVTNPSTPESKNLGYENDLVMKYRFTEWGILEAGYLFFLPTDGLKEIQGVENTRYAQFCYIQLTLNPTLFQWDSQSPDKKL